MESENERRKREGSFLLGPNRWERRKNEEKEKEGREKEDRGREKIEEERGRGKEIISWCFKGRSSTVQELKLVHAAEATRGYQSVSSKSKR